MEVFSVADDVTPKGAVIICPGGAFQFRSMQNEGYDVADLLMPMGYQCFVANYRISPYTMRESATDLQRSSRSSPISTIRQLNGSNFGNRMEAFNHIVQNAEIKPQVTQI